MRGLPLVCLFERTWYFFLIHLRHRDDGLDVFRADRATRELQQRRQNECAGGDETNCAKEVPHGRDPPVVLLLRRTGKPATRESDGSTMTASVGWRPETISTVLP